MLTELRYQAKIHAISNKPREKKNPANSPHFFLYLNKKMQYGNDIICKGKIKPVNAQ
jgi:hypothetical protein